MGYFGKIARQSGLRVGGGKPARPVFDSGAPLTREPLGPIDREEVVLVSPERSAVSPEKNRPPTNSAPSGSVKAALPVVPANRPGESEPIFEASLPEKAPAIAKPPEFTPLGAVSETPIQVEETSIRIGDEVKPSPAERSPRAIFEHEATIEPAVTFVREQPQDGEQKAAAVVNSDEERVPKSYFGQTSEILAGRGAEPAEVRTILIREIQEWIAAGPEPAIDPVTREVLIEQEPVRVFENTEMKEPEPGVVRIGEAPRERQRETAAATAANMLEEQSFELSIGTISVTIDDDGETRRTPEIKPIQTSSKENTTGNRPRGSRLSRHYI